MRTRSVGIVAALLAASQPVAVCAQWTARRWLPDSPAGKNTDPPPEIATTDTLTTLNLVYELK